MDYNCMTITGRLGRDPEIKSGSNGDFIVFPVAVNGYRDTTQWFDVAVFGKTADACHTYLTKGQRVLVSGELSADIYTKRDGSAGLSLNISARQVVFLSGRDESEGQPPRREGPSLVNDYGDTGDIPF